MNIEMRVKNGNLRSLQLQSHLIDFASNNYLGLGSTGSRLLTGNSALAEELEVTIAAFHGYETALLFNCGYMANLGLLSAIAANEDTILFDAEVHASTKDGIALSRAKAFPFRHHDWNHLEKRLQTASGTCFVCVESIYSTDGSKAPLQEICTLCKQYGAKLIVDEAHAVGICGPQGRGLVAELQLQPYIFAQIVTFGKAVGAFGAAILGSDTLKQGLINFSRPFIYSTALPASVLVAIKRGYTLFPTMEKERKQIQTLSSLFPHSHGTAIQAIAVPGNEQVKSLAHQLQGLGFDIRPLMSPTVRRGSERLRICLHAFNTEEQVKELLQCLNG